MTGPRGRNAILPGGEIAEVVGYTSDGVVVTVLRTCRRRVVPMDDLDWVDG